VQAAANGGGLVGSSLSVIQNLSNQAMFNARAAVYRGQSEARADLYQGAVAKQNGVNGLIGGVFGGASSLVGGWAQSASQSRILQAIQSGGGSAGGGGFAGASDLDFG